MNNNEYHKTNEGLQTVNPPTPKSGMQHKIPLCAQYQVNFFKFEQHNAMHKKTK